MRVGSRLLLDRYFEDFVVRLEVFFSLPQLGSMFPTDLAAPVTAFVVPLAALPTIFVAPFAVLTTTLDCLPALFLTEELELPPHGHHQLLLSFAETVGAITTAKIIAYAAIHWGPRNVRRDTVKAP